MIEKTKKQKKSFISEDGISSLLQRYSAATVLALLQEVTHSAEVNMDWNALVKNTSTGISDAREYQMLWRHLAYHHSLLHKFDHGALPLGHSRIRNGEPKQPTMVVQEGWQKKLGFRNSDHKLPAVVVLEGWQRNNGVVNKGKEIIPEFQNPKFQWKLTLDICFRVERGSEGKWGVIFSEVKEVGLKPNGLPALSKELAPARENRPIFKPTWKPRGSFIGQFGSFQKPKAQQPASSLKQNHVRSPSEVLPFVPCVSSLSQADPKSHTPAEVVPVSTVVTYSNADDIACSDFGKSESAIQNPKVSSVFLEPLVLNPAPTPLSELVPVNEQQFKHLLLDNVMDSNILRGFSDKWALELGDGKRVVVPMRIKRQPSGFFKGSVLDELNAMDISGISSRPLEVQSEWDGVGVEE
ncbi:hypothetical protein CMV_013069 [Castanea mollissima]|uniref:Uncharacterized protein n=1 Tax=Castanea mollissima TaxID=60419 RepID=A0A8J4VIK3_9ROSI|nr:hypothetical protein CMV_013069 [Castanea mollissima]